MKLNGLVRRVPRTGSLVKFNGHRLNVCDVLYTLLDITFEVTWVDPDGLLTMHSYPHDLQDTHVVMGVEPRLLNDLQGNPA